MSIIIKDFWKKKKKFMIIINIIMKIKEIYAHKYYTNNQWNEQKRKWNYRVLLVPGKANTFRRKL